MPTRSVTLGALSQWTWAQNALTCHVYPPFPSASLSPPAPPSTAQCVFCGDRGGTRTRYALHTCILLLIKLYMQYSIHLQGSADTGQQWSGLNTTQPLLPPRS